MFEVVLELAFEAVDREHVASSEVVHDPGEQATQTLRVVGRVERRAGCGVPRLLVLDPDRIAERPERSLRTFDIGGHTLLDGASKFEQVNVRPGTRGSRVHPGTLTSRR